jgi:hypothetical protein
MACENNGETIAEATNADAARSTDVRGKRAVQGLLAALKRGHHAEATRHFREAQACHLVPEDSQLEDWLGGHLGKRATAQLAKAFALTPCFYCKKGCESCRECNGRGHHAGTIICDTCLGIGTTRCDFCDGSAWVTINWVPSIFWIPVLTIRARSAAERLKVLLGQPMPEPSPRNREAALKKCSGALLVANSLIGVLENTVTAARQVGERNSEPNDRLSRLVSDCVRASVKADRFVRDMLQRMAAAARLSAEAAGPESEDGKLATNGAERYEVLSVSEDYAGTFLEHPFLRDAVLEASKRKEEQRPAAGGESSKREKSKRTRGNDTASLKESERSANRRRARQKTRGKAPR